jgi:uncharacterized protein involved in exopolysaccharide biosynthesis
MLQALRRRALWIVAALLLVCTGYTAGYLLSPPEQAAVSRTLPQAPADAPQPQVPSDPLDGAGPAAFGGIMT